MHGVSLSFSLNFKLILVFLLCQLPLPTSNYKSVPPVARTLVIMHALDEPRLHEIVVTVTKVNYVARLGEIIKSYINNNNNNNNTESLLLQ